MRFVLLLAAALAVQPALAQPTPPVRVKAVLVEVNGDAIVIRPMTGNARPAPDAPTRSVALTAETRYVESRKGSFADIKPGDYIGAAVSEGRGGNLRGNEVFLYDNALRGTGEGRFTERDRLLVNGTVRQVQPNSPTDAKGGNLILHYRGATLSPRGRDKAVCEGRAVPAPFASALACEADVVLQIGSSTPVSALAVGDRGLLAPGSIVTVTIARLGERDMAPGIIVEKPQSAP